MTFTVGDKYEIKHGIFMVITIIKVSKCFVWFIYVNEMNVHTTVSCHCNDFIYLFLNKRIFIYEWKG